MNVSKVLFVFLSVAVFVCAAKVVKSVSETEKLSDLKSGVQSKAIDEELSDKVKEAPLEIKLGLGSDSPDVVEIDEKSKEADSYASELTAENSDITKSQKTSASDKKSQDNDKKPTKSSAKLSPSEKLSSVITENSKDENSRSKKSPYGQGGYEQFRNSQHYMAPLSHTTTVCIVVKSHGHNHPVTLCGPQTNASEAMSTQPTETAPAARQSLNSGLNMNHGGMRGMQGPMRGIPVTSPLMHGMKPSVPMHSSHMYRMPTYEPPTQKSDNMQYQMIQPSGPPAIQKPYIVSSYPLNQNTPGNVVTSNVPLSLNCHLQPAGGKQLSMGHYITAGQPQEVISQDVYHKPGEARSHFEQLLEKEMPSPMYLMHETQRSAGPMFVLPDGSPIEGSNALLGSMNLEEVQLKSAQPEHTQHDVQWHQRSTGEIPIPWALQEHQTQPWDEGTLQKSAPEVVTQEFLRQWQNAYNQQMGRSADGPMDMPSVSYIPFYFHVNENQLRSDNNEDQMKASKPLTEEELKNKALMQEREIQASKQRLEELKAMLKASEDKIEKLTEAKKSNDDAAKMDDPNKTDPSGSKKEGSKFQEKRQTFSKKGQA